MQPAGEAAARAIYDALAEMAWRGEAHVEQTVVKREANGLTVSFHSDAMSVCEENADQVCAALMNAAAMHIRLQNEESFWFEVTVPCVFLEGAPIIEQSASTGGDKREKAEDAPLPEWLTTVFQAVKDEREALYFEDFTPNYEQIGKLADIYAAVKELSTCMSATFEFTEPKPPHNLHGGVHLKVYGDIHMDKTHLDALLNVISMARSFGVSNTNDGHIYLSFWINNIYLAKE